MAAGAPYGLAQGRDAFGGADGMLLEAVEVGSQELLVEIIGHAGFAERNGIGFPAAEGDAAGIGLHVDPVVRVAEGRGLGRGTGSGG